MDPSSLCVSPTAADRYVAGAGLTTIDGYLDCFPDEVRALLGEVRRTIHTAAPGAAETISYGIPTVTLDGRPLIYSPDGNATSASIPCLLPIPTSSAR